MASAVLAVVGARWMMWTSRRLLARGQQVVKIITGLDDEGGVGLGPIVLVANSGDMLESAIVVISPEVYVRLN